MKSSLAGDVLPPAPRGWYCVGRASELQPGQILSTTLGGEQIVVFRTAAGRAYALDAFCSHMGAHLGDGTVEGDALRCPFHGFCFDGEGACVRTGYGTRPPPKARLRTHRVQEVGDLLMVLLDPAALAPAWALPTIDHEGWTPLALHRFSLDGHPQETSENSVDLGHLAVTHGYHEVRPLEPARVEGPVLYTSFSFERRRRTFGLTAGVAAEARVEVHGLGFSLVHATLPRLGLRQRIFVLSTPTEPGRIDLRIGIQLGVSDPDRLPRPLRHLPLSSLLRLVLPIALRDICHDVEQDFRIWSRKRYIARPILAKGDGPIMLYRRWCRQFYETPTPLTPDEEPPAPLDAMPS